MNEWMNEWMKKNEYDPDKEQMYSYPQNHRQLSVNRDF